MEGTHLLFLQLVDICSLLNVFGAVNVSNCDWLWSLDQCGLDVVMFCRSCLSSAFECSEFVCKHFNCSYFSPVGDMFHFPFWHGSGHFVLSVQRSLDSMLFSLFYLSAIWSTVNLQFLLLFSVFCSI